MKALTKSISLLLCVMLLLGTSSLLSAAVEPIQISRISVCFNGDPLSRGLCWYTDIPTDSHARVFLDGVDVSDTLTFSGATSSEWELSYMHKLTVSGLESAKTYSYVVGNGEMWSEEGFFSTDDLDDSFNFIAIADVQAGSLENFQKGAATLSAAFDVMPDAEFVVNLGDFTDDSTNAEWDFYDEAFSTLNARSTIAPVSGNHDGLGVWHWFDNMFNLDTSESVQTLNGVNYSYDFGNAHFAVLNTNDIFSISHAQLKWLKNDMNGTDKDWKVVFMHKSPYSLGKDSKWPDALYLQQSLTAVLDECNVDLVMSGHDHMYLRTKAIRANELDSDGTVYVLAGTAGAKRYEVRPFCADSFLPTRFIDALTVQKSGYGNYWNGEDWESTSPNNIGGCFNCISIDGGTLTLKSFILRDEKDEQGNDVVTNIDTFTLTKQTGQNVASFDGDNTTSAVEYYLGVVPSFVSLATYTFGTWLPKFIAIIPRILVSYIFDGTF